MQDIENDAISVHNEMSLKALAEKTNLPVSHTQLDIDGFALFISDEILNLQKKIEGKIQSINVNFSSAAFTYRRELGGGKNQALGKAIGLNKNSNPYVIDGTAGMGKDAFVLAGLGCKVKMLEQSKIIGVLLHDGLKRAENDDEISGIIKNMNLEVINSGDYFKSEQCRQNPPDVIYLDPMYPGRKKTAKVKKEMQFFQQLLNHSDDQNNLSQLLDVSLNRAKNRVVVKRPKGAESLSTVIPTHTVESKKTRYDVYLVFR